MIEYDSERQRLKLPERHPWRKACCYDYLTAVRETLARRYRYRRRRCEWLDAREDEWPLVICRSAAPDGAPKRSGSSPTPSAQWIAAAWRGVAAAPGSWSGASGDWRTLGVQSLPERLAAARTAQSRGRVARGRSQRWQRASSRYRPFHASRWPALSARLAALLRRYWPAIRTPPTSSGWRALLAMAGGQSAIESVSAPDCDVAGIDSKWLEARMALIADLMAALQTDAGGSPDFYQRCGLKPLPHIVRTLLLDEKLRQWTGGLRDISARPEELAALDLPASRVYIVENLQTGVAFEDCPGAVVFMGLGYGVGALAILPWVMRAQCIYWGDVDTHGLAILSRARSKMPHLESALMDEHTLLSHRDLWVSAC
jgi:hypothetical protein